MRGKRAVVASCFLVSFVLPGIVNLASAQTVKVFGDYPPSGFCNQEFGPNAKYQTFRQGCNDTASGIDVPWGMSATLCDNIDPRWNDPNDDVAKTADLGYCRHFLPGRYKIDNAFNDKASSLKVGKGMVAYISSGDFPVDVTVGVLLKSPTERVDVSAGVLIGSSGSWVTQAYRVAIPSSCVQPHLRQTTSIGSANWDGKWSPASSLSLNLRVEYRQLLQGVWKGYANNNVGVELTCSPTDNGERQWPR